MTEPLTAGHPVVQAIMAEARATLGDLRLRAVYAGDGVKVPYASVGTRGDYRWVTLMMADGKLWLSHDHTSPWSPCTSLGELTGEVGTLAAIQKDMAENNSSD